MGRKSVRNGFVETSEGDSSKKNKTIKFKIYQKGQAQWGLGAVVKFAMEFQEAGGRSVEDPSLPVEKWVECK